MSAFAAVRGDVQKDFRQLPIQGILMKIIKSVLTDEKKAVEERQNRTHKSSWV